LFLVVACMCSLFGFWYVNKPKPEIPSGIIKLQKAYPDYIASVKENSIVFNDGTEMIYDDGIVKNMQEKLENPDLEDMMSIPYPKGDIGTPDTIHEAGRIRVDTFFKKIYGHDEATIRANLKYSEWLPYGDFRHVKMNRINNVNVHIAEVAKELKVMEPRFHKYFYKIAGTFSWRTVHDKPRLSPHSFGIAIDLNTKYSSYWDWDDAFGRQMKYKNEMPWEIVEIFERHGFIWGGKWYHYDTMHFEYRPELLVD
jgi:peptidoglycan LD-endopeptidase CwlK